MDLSCRIGTELLNLGVLVNSAVLVTSKGAESLTASPAPHTSTSYFASAFNSLAGLLRRQTTTLQSILFDWYAKLNPETESQELFKN